MLKAKVKRELPKRPLGEGYDSDASDREDDPTIKEGFILRIFPGDSCEYLRTAISEKKIGFAKALGSADVHVKFFSGEGRRAAMTTRRYPYAATLVDLPCVVEGMKSWGRRSWWKSADICQMLCVFAPIKEEEAKGDSVARDHRPQYISISSVPHTANALCTQKMFPGTGQ